MIISFTAFAQQPNFEWVKQISGPFTQSTSSIVSNSNGEIYIAGLFFGVANLDSSWSTPDLVSNGSYDVFIQRLMPMGILYG